MDFSLSTHYYKDSVFVVLYNSIRLLQLIRAHRAEVTLTAKKYLLTKVQQPMGFETLHKLCDLLQKYG